MERRLAAILSADVVGYSRLIEQDETSTLAALKERRRDILNPLVARYHGRVVKIMGDGALVEFASAVNAVACAVELQKQMAAANNDTADGRHIVLRVGINLGDVVVEGGDLYGDGVIVAARLQALAAPGDIWIAASVHDQIEKKLALDFEDLGPREVKNMARPVHVYRVGTGTLAVQIRTDTGVPAKPSVAVLPFVNLSGDPDQQYFSDGITDDIITGLSRFHVLLVIARSSSFVYKDRVAKVQDVGRALAVRYVLEGSVRKYADKVRITAQLVDTATASHVWAGQYDHDLKDIFAVQDEVTGSIVATVMGRVRNADRERARDGNPENLAAYDLLLRGRASLDKWSMEGILRARPLFDQAIALDPRYSTAHADLALTHLQERSSRWTRSRDAAGERGFELARKAVALNDSDAWAHLALANAYLNVKADFEMAEVQVGAAFALNPNEYWNFCFKSWLLTLSGDADESVACVNQAIRLNPFAHDGCLYSEFTAHYCARRYDEAILTIAKIADPPFEVSACLAACYAQCGRDADARRAMEAFSQAAATMLPDDPAEGGEAWRQQWARWFPFKHAADFEHLLDGLRKAGLPV